MRHPSTAAAALDPGSADPPVARVTPSRVRWSLGLFLIGLLAFAASWLLSRSPAVVETVFVNGWARIVVVTLSRITGFFPFPLIEVLGAAYIGWRLWTAGRGAARVVRRIERASPVLASGFLVVLRDAGIGLLLFYGLWGFHYARAPLADRLGLPTVQSVSTPELVSLGREMVRISNESYRQIHGKDDAEQPTRLPEDWHALASALGLGWERTAEVLPVGPLTTRRFGRPKPMFLSPLMAYLGITGIYSPFTAEPLVVGTVPAVSLGLGIAHEQAHQRGITGEGEATFLGFVAAARSGHPTLRYSAAVRAQLRIVSLLAARDPSAARELTSSRLPGVTRDLVDLREYQLRHRGRPSRATSRVNDAYLRTNRVPGGVENYGEVTGLLLRLARHQGGVLLPDGEGESGSREHADQTGVEADGKAGRDGGTTAGPGESGTPRAGSGR